MRVVLDTNVLIDAFSDDFSAQARLLQAVLDGKITAITTSAVHREYRKILHRLIDDAAFTQRIADFLAVTEKVTPQFVEATIDDPEDYKIIEAAIGGGARLIVTLDRHLLALGEIQGVKIVSPQEAWIAWQEQDEMGSGWATWAKGLGIGQ